MIKNRKQSFLCGLIILFFFCSIGTALPQEKNVKKLTYDQVYNRAEPRLFGSLPPIRSALDDEHYLLSERDEKTKMTNLYKVNVKSGKKTLFFDYGKIQKNLPKNIRAMTHRAITPDYSRLLYSFQNDLYHYSVRTGEFKRLTSTPDPENNPRFSPNGKYIAYTRNHNLYALDIDMGLEYQLSTDGSDTIYNGWASWVYYEEILGRGSRYRAFWWSPDSTMLAFLRFDDSPVPIFPIFRARGAHGELERER